MRDRVALGLALVVTLAVVGGAAWWVLGREPRDPQAEAAAVAGAYARAWAAGDWGALANLVAQPPADLASQHATMWERLGVTGATVEPGSVILDRTQATTSLAVTLTIGELGTVAYTTTLRLVEDREVGWQVTWSPSTLHPDYAPGRTWERTVSDAERAPILAWDGTPLTTGGERQVIGVQPGRVADPEEVAAAFAEHTDVPAEQVRALLARSDLRADWFYPVVTVRTEAYPPIRDALYPVPGIVFRSEEARLAPTDDFAAHVLGRTGEITAELIDELGPPYEAGDTVGRSGLERAFERQLAGTPRVELYVADGDGDRRATLAEFQGSPPTPLRTTLDRDVQLAAEQAMAGVERGALVVVDAATGAIRASVSRPLDEFDRALGGRYPPGSTFKVVTTSALLDAGVEPDRPVACPARTVVGGLVVPNAGDLDLGEVPFRTAFARSCNTSFARLAADALEDGDLAAAAARFGFDAAYDLGLPTAQPQFPAPRDLAERAAAAFGQARVLASPVHLATVAGAVATGAWHAPFLLADAGSSATRTVPDRHASVLRDLMRRVVTEGTGTAAEVPGDPVHGKTGSAEADRDGERLTHAWFTGFRGALAFTVLVEGGGSGGEVAAPVAARFLRALDAGP